MSPLRNVPYRTVARALMRLGFEVARQRGSHVRFAHPDGRSTTVPHHEREPLGPRLLRGIAKDIGMSADEFERLLR